MRRLADNHDDVMASSPAIAKDVNSSLRDGNEHQISQIPNSSSNMSANLSKPTVQRHRASIACVSCRERRIRCVVPPGGQECTQCKRSKTKCVIRNDDERRRPISKGYVTSLTDRIALLETILMKAGSEIPPANYQPKTRAKAATQNDASSVHGQQYDQQNITPGSTSDESMDGDKEDNGNETTVPNFQLKPYPPQTQTSSKAGLVDILLSARGHLRSDKLSSQLRFFGPTANFHIHVNNNATSNGRGTPEQLQRAQRAIYSLSNETRDYLMDLFWEYHNRVLHIVHKEAFVRDMQNNKNTYYSSFLHICILAMGYRYADRKRDDMKRIGLGARECTLQREAKSMLDMELERPGGIPAIQAFLLLGDLECGVGRDSIGWVYSGIANRLCFDVGLHLPCIDGGLSEDEIHIRHMALLACVIYDKYWALFLGRPTAIKSLDLGIDPVFRQFSYLSSCKPAGNHKSLETQIYAELLDLMELADRIADMRYSALQGGGDVDQVNIAYLEVMNLGKQLQVWHRELPDNLTWKPENIETAPFSFFLLHQQYHCSLILLHRPWAMYENLTPSKSHEGKGDSACINIKYNYSFMSRSICTRRAILISRIFWHHRQRFDARRTFITGVQHAGTAAIALVATLSFNQNAPDRKINIQHLQYLTSVLHDMSTVYQPAASMYSLLQSVILELQSIDETPLPDSKYVKQENRIIPGRNSSNGYEIEEGGISEKHQSSKPSSKRSPVNFKLCSTAMINPSFIYTSTTTPLSSMSADTSGITTVHTHLGGDVDRHNGSDMITSHSEPAILPNGSSDVDTSDYDMTFQEMVMADTQVGWWSNEELDLIFPDNVNDGTGVVESLERPRGGQELDFFSL